MNPNPMPFDIVHPALKKECSIVVCGDTLNLHRCYYCGERYIYRNYLIRCCIGGVFCSWDCAIEYEDYMNWRYEMERKGYQVDLGVWHRTKQGTKYFEMLEESSRNMEKKKDVNQ